MNNRLFLSLWFWFGDRFNLRSAELRRLFDFDLRDRLDSQFSVLLGLLLCFDSGGLFSLLWSGGINCLLLKKSLFND